MKFLIAFIFCGLIVGAGAYFQEHQAPHQEFSLSIDFKSVRRLVYDQAKIHENRDWEGETILGLLSFGQFKQNVELSVIPSLSQKPFAAFEIQVGEEVDVEFHDLVLVRNDLPEFQEISKSANLAILKQGELYLNGKSIGAYSLIANPFLQGLSQGISPLVKNGEMSKRSKKISSLVNIFEQKKNLLEKVENVWFGWDTKNNQWIKFCLWPEGWPI
ncbi:MAG: hypothetical protein K2P81_06310 [Bacteriovoracaceae bacterium]|nr:hypothetical protein [Bacteriovoracaceae bacterium]